MPRLVIQAPGQEALLYELVKPRITMGRSEQNDLVLNDINASRFHAVLAGRGSPSRAGRERRSRPWAYQVAEKRRTDWNVCATPSASA